MTSADRSGPPMLTSTPWIRGVLVISVLIIAVGWALRTLADAGSLLGAVLVPVALSVLLTALLMPLQVLLNHKLGLPRALGGALTIVTALGAVLGVLWVAGAQLAAGLGEIVEVFRGQLDEARRWLVTETPFGAEQIDDVIVQAQAWLDDNRMGLAQGALGAGAGAAGFFVSVILALVATVFFLTQGDRIWAALVVLLPSRWHRDVYEASRRGWVTLSTYCRTQLLVSAVDAVGIGLGAFALGVPFVIPIMGITFVLCFIPFVGAIVSGAVAVAMALAFQGPGVALLMLLVVVLVQQVESNVLSPLLMGRAVDVHPLLILLSVAAATYVFGLVGALFAVPAIATVKSMVLYLNDADPFPGLATGGRALTTSPKALIGDREDVANPRRIGDASPRWLVREQAQAEREAAQAEQARAKEAEQAEPDGGAARE
ncbi:MAG: AI-2E family transporter [Propionibacteriaceae bacterium]|nr:AI-2E family transporter [Propionibacteriaceae bacterium]